MRGMILLYAVAALLRLWLMNSATLSSAIRHRVEISTPLNSWLRVKEGVYLQSHGVSVYSGGVFHESPLTLFLGGILIRSWGGWWTQFVFVACDLLTAFLLSRTALAYANKLVSVHICSVHFCILMQCSWLWFLIFLHCGHLLSCFFSCRSWGGWWTQFVFVACDLFTAFLLSRTALAYANKLLGEQRDEMHRYASDSSHLLLSAPALAKSGNDVAAAYLLCPYTVLSCVAMTTTTFHNVVLAALLLAMLKGRAVIFGALVALATYQVVYPVVVLVPGLIALYQYHADPYHRNCASAPPIPDSYEERQQKLASGHCVRVLGRSLAASGAAAALLLLVSAEIAGGWHFIHATYGFILSAPDLTPNIGLFWYFFTEMFEHFRLFFLAVFQLNALVYVVPLCVRLRSDPMLLCTALLALSAVFRSYPALGDVGFYLSLLPLCSHLYPFLRQSFLVGCMLVASSVLGPIMYNQWIYSGAANANFYFAVTLAFNTAQIFLVTDLLFGHVKRQHLLYNGSSMTVEGQPARLTLE
ncbi:GPI transamidase subunit PIG-U [Trinorchestia longiramus]|nr:GPI transamidase subunit PIG-U [Trinorchestia longiramus]